MRRSLFNGLLALSTLGIGCAVALAQTGAQTPTDQAQPDQTQQAQPDHDQTGPVNVGPGQTVPIYKITVVGSTVPAVNYRHRSGTTKLGFRGTSLLARAEGGAEVKSQAAATAVVASFKHLPAASTLGPEYLTYVLWAISTDGRPVSLGEIVPNDDGNAHLDVTTPLQAFGLVVTAEPYFSVTRPSDDVVMQNEITSHTNGTIEEVDAKFELLKRGQYTTGVDQSQIAPLVAAAKTPLSVLEAQNAIRIAQWAGADKYAADTLSKAQLDLQNAQSLVMSKGDKHEVDTLGREAAQVAEDARVITLNKIADHQRFEQQQAEVQATAQAAQSQKQAEEAQQQAEQAARQQAQAEAARQAAMVQQQQAQAQAQQAQATAQEASQRADQAEKEKAEMRTRLLNQLNTILQTRDTARGLVVNVSDVLFATGRYELKPQAQLALAKIAGVLLAYPGMTIEVDGYTDSVGSDQTNDALSQKRANSVRDFLVKQGVSPSSISSRGFGEQNPVASNDTSTGRAMNRRVNLVVTGELIGTQTASAGGSK